MALVEAGYRSLDERRFVRVDEINGRAERHSRTTAAAAVA
jgi:hypothetical protein